MKHFENGLAQAFKRSTPKNYKFTTRRADARCATDVRIPKNVFRDHNLTVFHAPEPRDAARTTDPRFLLFAKPPPPPTPYRPPPRVSNFALKMLNWVQLLTTPTADTNGTAILLHFDNQRYVFGNIAEGLQRVTVQRKISLGKVEDFFITGPVNWRNAGGLLGMMLTIADQLAEAAHSHAQQMAAKGKKKHAQSAIASKITIHAGKNLCHLLATSRRFIFRKGFPLCPKEIRDDPRAGDKPTFEPDFSDNNIKVWYMPVEPKQSSPTAEPSKVETPSPRKRTHDEFAETSVESPSADPHKFAEAVVSHMFNSNWTADALVETTLHEVKLPAKLFVREEGRLKVYEGPMPGNGVEVPDIPVLVRKPWPGATISSLPPTTPSPQSMCYIVTGHDRRGKFDGQAAAKLGVEKREFRLLANGESVTTKDGNVVSPDMVMAANVPGTGFAVVNLPDTSYIEALLSRPEWTNDQIMKGVLVVFWILGEGLAKNPRIQQFMQKLSSIKHIVTSTDTSPNMIALESSAAQAYKLRCVDPDRFPLPHYNNELSLSGAPSASVSPDYEVGRTGKTIQFAPHFLEKDDKIVPFPNIKQMADEGLDEEVLSMAAKARSRISDPDFLSAVEKAEADIPNRDAEIITLGTGSALPSKYRNVSATLVRVPGHGSYLFDVGENTLGQLRRVLGAELPSVLRDLKAIWISHLHADHHLGTVSVIRAWNEETRKSYPDAKLLVASHTHMIDWLREYADVENYGFGRLVTTGFEREERQNPGSMHKQVSRSFTDEETAQFGLSKIEGCWVQHCFGALAVVFTFPSGFKVAYSGDCRPCETFVKIGGGATVLIHESTFDDEMRGDAIAKKHSTMSEAIDVGRRMGARRILLTHFSQRYQKIPLMEEKFEVQPDAAAEGEDKAKVDEVILVAFDYMRVKVGEFRMAQAFLPAVQKLLEESPQ